MTRPFVCEQENEDTSFYLVSKCGGVLFAETKYRPACSGLY